MTSAKRPAGMTSFTFVWFGQVVSLLGTSMTGFALSIWAWQETGLATALALVGFFRFGPAVLLIPLAGALVDRWNRKLLMMLSDIGAGLSTAALLVLYLSGNLEIWHLYLTGAVAGAFSAFHFPAYSAAVTMMVSKRHYARASGMLSLAESASAIAAPLLAGVLLGPVGLVGILVLDLIALATALVILLVVHIPQPRRSEAGGEGRGSLLKESLYGFRYILARPSLLGLQLVFFCINLTSTFGNTVLAAMILSRTGNDELALGSVLSAGGVGGVAGGLLLSLWGGPRRRVHGVLLGMVFGSLLGQVLMGLGGSLPMWMLASFLFVFFIPILNGSNQAIWQAKVAPDVQGRVFATRRLIAQITIPLAMLMAGPLADRVFEPAMMPGGALAAAFSPLVGTGPGAGMALMFVVAGLFGAAVGLGAYLFSAVRNAEDILPDHEEAAESAEGPGKAEAAGARG
ncbi:MFS transporter [soil metagenome]